jgi:hypothetical protein
MRISSLLAGAAIAICGSAAEAGWTERYFGVGSATDRSTACEQARGHAQENSTVACVRGHGARGDAGFTECVCTRTWEAVHVCNVNLRVACDGPASSPPALRRGGEPRGRADTSRGGTHRVASASSRRPGPEVLAEAR